MAQGNSESARPTGPARGGWLVTLNSLGSAVRWAAMAGAATQGATLVTNVLVARLVGVAGFGLYSFALSAMNVVVILVQSSLGLVANRYLPDYRQNRPSRVLPLVGAGIRKSYLSATIVGLILALQGILASPHALDAAWLLTMVVVGAGSAFAGAAQFRLTCLAGFEDWRRYAVAAVGMGIALLVCSLCGALIAGVVGALCGLLVAQVIRNLVVKRLLTVVSIEYATTDTIPDPEAMGGGKLSRFALPALFTASTHVGSLWIGTILLVSQPNGPYHLGLYAAVYTLRTAVIFFPAQLATVSVAALSRLSGQSDRLLYARTFVTSFGIAATASVVTGAMIWALSPVLLPLFGSEFGDADGLLKLMLIAGVLEALGSAAYQTLPSRERMWRAFICVALPRDALFIGLSWWLVPSYFGFGLAIGLICSQAWVLMGTLIANRTGRRAEAA